jgi:hypothetical protein
MAPEYVHDSPKFISLPFHHLRTLISDSSPPPCYIRISMAKPPSPAQLAANRANAARSTGPHTPEGKARSSNCFSLFLRYQAQAERQYRRAVEAFDLLRSRDRQEAVRNEANSESQLEQNESLVPPSGEPVAAPPPVSAGT